MAGRLRPHLRVAHRKVLAAPRDITGSTTDRSALVIAPHPDDETLGCGATIARKTAAGTTVRVVVVADGSLGYADDDPSDHSDLAAQRETECRAALERLGVGADDVVFLGVGDAGVADAADDVEARLRAIVDDLEPDDVFAPFAKDNNPDHRALGAVVDRLRATSLHDSDVYAYPVWLWNRWAWTTPSAPRWRQNVAVFVEPVLHTLSISVRSVTTGVHLEQKRSAMAEYRTQREILDADWLETFFGPVELFFALQERR